MSEQNVFEQFPWITNHFVESVIKKSEPNRNVVLKSFNVTFAFKNGQNFSSDMVTISAVFDKTCDGGEIKRDFLMKIALQTEDFAKICEECHIYEREIEAYTKVLPAVEKCFDTVGISGRIAPRCFLADIEKKVLVFEDLREHQFKSVDRMHGLDREHLKLSLVALAKWHAGTATLLLTNPELFEWYTKKVVYQNAPMLNSFFDNIAKGVGNTVKDLSGFENIANKLINIPKSVHENIYKLYMPQKDGFNVITHGDMFLNNILFRHDPNGNPIDIRLVDFPIGKHLSPAIDLVCLLYGSASSSIRQRDREHLIRYYHSELIKNLKLLKFPATIPTLLDIQSATFRADLYSALIVLFITGLRYVHKSFDGGFLEAADNGETAAEKDSEKLYSHPKCLDQLKYLLDLFDRRGYFDY